MLQPLLIALVAVVLIHDAEGSYYAANAFPPYSVGAATLGAYGVIILLTHLQMLFRGRAIDRTGSARHIHRAESFLGSARLAATLIHAASVLVFGWLDIVRRAIGDLILIDELVVLAPPLLVFVAGWWSFYPIERRIREAMIIRSLDTACAIYAPPTRWQFVADRLRHQALLILVPILLVLTWAETLNFLAMRYGDRMTILANPARASLVLAGVQLAGVAVIFLFSPALMRHIWSTIPLADGPVRERLADLCRRHAVRVRQMLVWRTHGQMINGAVMGLIGRLRYILLTDALLDSLPQEQVEAVMAHEVGHVRRHHLPWLIAAMLASLGLGSMAIALPLGLAAAMTGLDGSAPVRTILDAGATIGAIVAGLLVFGFVSRRFERQADAFAVQHLSGLTKANKGRGLVATPHAADAMAGALTAVAELNHIPRRRFTWRHGSIAGRQTAIHALVGRPLDRFPVDRAVRRLKLITLGALALLITLATLDATGHLLPAPDADDAPLTTTALTPYCAPTPGLP